MAEDDKNNPANDPGQKVEAAAEEMPDKDKDDLVSRLATAAAVVPVATVLVDAATNSALAS